MRRWVRALRHGLREAWDGLWRNPALSMLSSVSIGVSIYVVGLFLLVAFNLNQYVDALGRDVQAQIYLEEDATMEAIRSLRDALRADDAVDTVRFVTKQAAQRRFRETFPTLRNLSETIKGNPFPASFELTLPPEARDASTLEALAERFQSARGVEEVRFDLGWMERLSGMVRLVRSGGYGLGVLLGLAMMVTVGAVVRLTVLARREEIEIMKLVGATVAFIRGPFLLSAGVQGILGGGLAVGALLLTHRLIGMSDLAGSSPFLVILGGDSALRPGNDLRVQHYDLGAAGPLAATGDLLGV